MGYKFNPFTGSLDTVDSPNGVFEAVEVNGDITLDDGGTYTTTLQTITPTAARTISLPDATGTVALVAGSSGQLLWNNAGVNAGASTLTYDGSILTSSGRFINSYNATASSPAKAFTGTWFTGGTGTTTKPQVLIEPTGATSTAWSTSGTGLGVNAASGFTGNLLDLQINGSNRYQFRQDGTSFFRGDQYWTNLAASVNYGRFDAAGLSLTSTGLVEWGNTTNVTGFDTALKRESAGVVRVTDASTGNGTLLAQHRLVGTAPASATATGTAGDIRYDASYIYICTATDTWKRAAITTWV